MPMRRTIPWPNTLLISYHYGRNIDMDAVDEFRVVGDSGAFSARTQGITITNDELGEWANKWRHKLFWVACMDVAGNPKLTRHNWLELNRDHNLQSVPTLHMGDDPSEMDFYVERGCDFIGLGGLAGGQAQARSQIRWLLKVFIYARDNHPHVRFHGWGLTREETKKLPFWSVDSSSWSSAFRYGLVILRDPRRYKRVTFQTDRRGAYQPHIVDLLTNHYATNPHDVAFSDATTRQAQMRVSILAKSVYEQEMRRLHKASITPPKWGIMNPGGYPMNGPHVAMADSSAEALYTLNELKKRDKLNWPL